MRVIALYDPKSEQARALEELNRELARRGSSMVELLSTETIDGSEMTQIYDVMQYPTLLALDSRGQLQFMSSDGTIPLINDVSYYLNQ